MRKSDLKQFSNLLDERLDIKFDEKLKNFATKDDLKQFATKDDLKQFATKDDLKQFATKDDLDRLAINTNKSFEELDKKMGKRFDAIDKKLLDCPTRNEIFDKWDNKISQIACDVDSLKYLHKDEWRNLPSRSVIKNNPLLYKIKENYTK